MVKLPNVIFDKWVFIIVVSVALVITVPLFIVWFVLQLGPELRLAATILIIVIWGVVSGYKDWIIAKRKEEKAQKINLSFYILSSLLVFQIDSHILISLFLNF